MYFMYDATNKANDFFFKANHLDKKDFQFSAHF